MTLLEFWCSRGRLICSYFANSFIQELCLYDSPCPSLKKTKEIGKLCFKKLFLVLPPPLPPPLCVCVCVLEKDFFSFNILLIIIDIYFHLFFWNLLPLLNKFLVPDNNFWSGIYASSCFLFFDMWETFITLWNHCNLWMDLNKFLHWQIYACLEQWGMFRIVLVVLQTTVRYLSDSRFANHFIHLFAGLSVFIEAVVPPTPLPPLL